MNWIWFIIGIIAGISLGIYCRRWFINWGMRNRIINMVLVKYIYKSGKQFNLLTDKDSVGG